LEICTINIFGIGSAGVTTTI